MTSPRSSPDDSKRTELERGLAIIRRHITLIGLCLLATAAAAFGISELQTKEYSASASLLFRNPGFAEELFGSSPSATNPVPAREAATNERLVGLRVVATRAARRLGLTPDQVAGMVSVESEGEAELVSVAATSAKPAQAMRVANVFARQFIAFRADADRKKLLEAKRLAERELERLSAEEREGARGEALSRGAEKLGILASLQTGNAELVQPASLPSGPSSPKPVRNGILGAILGLLLGLGLAFLLERLNRRLRDPDEAKEVFEMPIVGTIPESKAITATNEGAAAPELPFVENEAFRMLSSSLRYFNVDHDLHTIAITSHGPGVGKSTVAWNLARVAATSARVVVVEADLRNPSLAQQHGIRPRPGLAELLTHQVDLERAVVTKPLSSRGADAGRLDVIVCGTIPPNPAELIESQAMRDLLSQLTERYELVVVDTAPLGVVSDAFPLLRQVDGVLPVARMSKSTRDSAVRLREQLDRLEAPILGLVANGIKVPRRARYGYGYYGGYYGKPSENGATADATPEKAADPSS
ncbi:MAG TPA: polysaccharide biosynthesis tyrosine autokinase [Solirubrobacterales bacterium]|nr:polysaccharide biosynthesis tyrosine autokinase [Solirubrobacterales bacterium]